MILILVTTVIKLFVAGFLELGNDEVYYWTYALQIDWNHFDHPPMIGWMIQLTSFHLHWVSEISLRLGAILGAGLATWFIYLTASTIASEKQVGMRPLFISHLFIRALLQDYLFYLILLKCLFGLQLSI